MANACLLLFFWGLQPGEASFNVGQRVRVKDAADKDWKYVMVTSVNPEDWKYGMATTDAELREVAKFLPQTLEEFHMALYYSEVTDAGVTALAQSLPQTLRNFTMDLYGTEVSDAGVTALAQSLPQTLQGFTMDLRGTKVSDPGVIALAQSLPQTLWDLTMDLRSTKVSDAGVITLAQSLPQTLRDLTMDLTSTKVSDAGVVALVSSLPEAVQSVTISSSTFRNSAGLRLCEYHSNHDLCEHYRECKLEVQSKGGLSYADAMILSAARSSCNCSLEIIKGLVDNRGGNAGCRDDMYNSPLDFARRADASPYFEESGLVQYLEESDTLSSKVRARFASSSGQLLLTICGGILLGTALARLLEYLQGARSDQADQEESEEEAIPEHRLRFWEGAVLLAQKSIAKARWGKPACLGKKLFRFVQVISHIPFLCGPTMWIINPDIVLLFMVCAFMLPAVLLFGTRRLAEHPVLSITAPAGHRLECLMASRALPMIAFLYSALTLMPKRRHPWSDPWSDCTPHCGELLGITVLNQYFQKSNMMGPDVQLAMILFAILCICAVLLQAVMAWIRSCWRFCSQRGFMDDADPGEVESLAEIILEASAMGGASRIAALPEGVVPIVWHPRPSELDIGMCAQAGLIVADMCCFDVSTLCAFLLVGHFRFACFMITIFVASAVMEWRKGNLQRFPSEVAASVNAIPSNRLLSSFRSETGFEAFLSLGLTAYGAFFCFVTPLSVVNGIASMLVSCWGLATRLYELEDLGSLHRAGHGAHGLSPVALSSSSSLSSLGTAPCFSAPFPSLLAARRPLVGDESCREASRV